MQPLDLRCQSQMMRCWFRCQRLPESVPCQLILQDSRLSAITTCHKFPKPLGVRAGSLVAALPVPICPYRLPRIGYWQLPRVYVCPPVIDSRRDLPPYVPRALFLEHSSSHSDSIPQFTDGSKSDTGVGFSVVFPSFY